MTFVWLVPTMSKHATGLSGLNEFDIEEFEGDEPIKSLGEGYFTFDRDLNKRYGPRVFGGDRLENESGLWVVSTRLRDFFIAEEIVDVHFVSVDIFEGRKKHEGYFVMQFLTGIDGIDERESTISYGFGGVLYVDNLALRADVIGDDKLFKMSELPDAVFATEEFAAKMKAEGFESFLIKPLSEFGAI